MTFRSLTIGCLLLLLSSGTSAQAQVVTEPMRPDVETSETTVTNVNDETLAPGDGVADDGAVPPSAGVTNDGEETAEDEDEQILAFINHKNFNIVLKNVTQNDQSGDSQFGVGIDWQYAFGKDFFFLLPSRVMVSGSGMTSLGDPNTAPEEASEAANFNSITNQFRYSANHLFQPERESFPERPPVGDPVALADWKERAKKFAREQETRIAEGYTGVDLGFQAQTESSQTFRSTQLALGGSASIASSWATNRILYPLKYLVPDSREHGNVIRPVVLFTAIEEVLFGNDEALESDASSNFSRFRLEVAWSTELVLRGLYPFAFYHLYENLSGDAAAGKGTAQWLEVGVNYYVGNQIEALRQWLNTPSERGPFVTLRYASGELPPYLEPDHQASVGLGFDF